MGLAEDLLQQAWYLAKKERKTPRQASLRRAVSTAYYALFHFLVDEAVGKWDIARQRSVLARPFEHGKMYRVCDQCVKTFYKVGEARDWLPLKRVALAFTGLQAQLQLADYDNALIWSRAEAIGAIDRAHAAFQDWSAICHSDAAHDFLLQLFLPTAT